jgi:primase-polymerase (primpol)-like protein
LRVSPDNIPAALRRLRQFGVWRFELTVDEDSGDTSWDKIPHNARTGFRASSTAPHAWSSFDAALSVYQRGGYDGLAFFLRSAGGLVGIDLDRCRDLGTGTIEPWAQRIVDRLNTYAELSPSGRGLRLFLWAELPPRDRREGRFECYSSARFLTLTGHHLEGTPQTIERRQADLIAVHSEIFAARVAKREAATRSAATPRVLSNLSDAQIIERACSMRGNAGAKFRALWAGDARAYRSHSEADLALAGYLAFFVGPDASRIDELFRASGLFRGKWNRTDYRNATIQMALSGRGQFYTPPKRSEQQHQRPKVFSRTFRGSC